MYVGLVSIATVGMKPAASDNFERFADKDFNVKAWVDQQVVSIEFSCLLANHLFCLS